MASQGCENLAKASIPSLWAGQDSSKTACKGGPSQEHPPFFVILSNTSKWKFHLQMVSLSNLWF